MAALPDGVKWSSCTPPGRRLARIAGMKRRMGLLPFSRAGQEAERGDLAATDDPGRVPEAAGGEAGARIRAWGGNPKGVAEGSARQAPTRAWSAFRQLCRAH